MAASDGISKAESHKGDDTTSSSIGHHHHHPAITATYQPAAFHAATGLSFYLPSHAQQAAAMAGVESGILQLHQVWASPHNDGTAMSPNVQYTHPVTGAQLNLPAAGYHQVANGMPMENHQMCASWARSNGPQVCQNESPVDSSNSSGSPIDSSKSPTSSSSNFPGSPNGSPTSSMPSGFPISVPPNATVVPATATTDLPPADLTRKTTARSRKKKRKSKSPVFGGKRGSSRATSTARKSTKKASRKTKKTAQDRSKQGKEKLPRHQSCTLCHKARTKCLRRSGPTRGCERCGRLQKRCILRPHKKKGRPRKDEVQRKSGFENMPAVICGEAMPEGYRYSFIDVSGLDYLKDTQDVPSDRYYTVFRDVEETNKFGEQRVAAWRYKYTPEFVSHCLSTNSHAFDREKAIDNLFVNRLGDRYLASANGLLGESGSPLPDITFAEPTFQSSCSLHELDGMGPDGEGSVDWWPIACLKLNNSYGLDEEKQVTSCAQQIYSNRSFEMLFGLRREEVMDVFKKDPIPNLSRLLHPEDWCLEQRNVVNGYFVTHDKPNATISYKAVYRARNKYGNVTPVLTTVKVSFDENCMPAKTIVLMMPIPCSGVDGLAEISMETDENDDQDERMGC